jgi:ABC-type sugar transport system ATPase subunit
VDAELHYGNPLDFTLRVPEFSVARGEVVAVVGRVGSGARPGALSAGVNGCFRAWRLGSKAAC